MGPGQDWVPHAGRAVQGQVRQLHQYKCKRYDTWGVTYGSDSLKDDQPLKPATYGVEWVLVKEHILDSVTAAEATAAEGNDAEMTL